MKVKVGSRWRDVIANAVESGRYASEEDVVSEGLRLVAEREQKFAELKRLIDEAYEDDKRYTSEEVAAAVDAALADLDVKAAAE